MTYRLEEKELFLKAERVQKENTGEEETTIYSTT
jgi:hypothetical protein